MTKKHFNFFKLPQFRETIFSLIAAHYFSISWGKGVLLYMATKKIELKIIFSANSTRKLPKFREKITELSKPQNSKDQEEKKGRHLLYTFGGHFSPCFYNFESFRQTFFYQLLGMMADSARYKYK